MLGHEPPDRGVRQEDQSGEEGVKDIVRDPI